jgi:hypothetical protein
MPGPPALAPADADIRERGSTGPTHEVSCVAGRTKDGEATDMNP